MTQITYAPLINAPAMGIKQATPATVARVLAGAQGGEMLVLAAGVYSKLAVKNRSFDPPITIDARAATFVGPDWYALSLTNCTGIHWNGGLFTSAFNAPPTVRGIVLNKCRDINFYAPSFDNIRSDGIDIAASHDIGVYNSSFSGFTPRKPVYDKAGKLVKDGDHADAIQLTLGSGNVIISGFEIAGDCQGIGAYWHTSYAPYGNLLVENGTINIAMPNALNFSVFAPGTKATVRNVKITTMPGSKYRASNNANGLQVTCTNVTVGPKR